MLTNGCCLELVPLKDELEENRLEIETQIPGITSQPSLLRSGVDGAADSVRRSTLVDGSFRFEGKQSSVRNFGGKASVISEIINMTKNLIGYGTLSLSGGMALFSDNAQAALSATCWIVILGFMFAYFFVLIAKVCQLTKGVTYREIWKATVGVRGALLVSMSTALKAALGYLAQASILSQTFVSLLASGGAVISRNGCMLIITVVAILPLCLLKNLQTLTPSSLVGTSCMCFTCAMMAVRYFDGSYQEGGAYYDTIDPNLRPSFGTINEQWSTDVLPFVCMVYGSYVIHYNAPRFYTELNDNTIKRFSIAVGFSFGFSCLMYIGIASFGFLTFGGNSSNYILNNYSTKDPLANASRFAVGISTLSTVPLLFIGFRDGILDVLEVPPEKQTSPNLNALTVVLLSILTIVALFVTDLGLINAVGGGTLASAIVFLFPSIMYSRMYYPRAADPRRCREAIFVVGLAVAGLILGVIGAWVAILTIDGY